MEALFPIPKMVCEILSDTGEFGVRGWYPLMVNPELTLISEKPQLRAATQKWTEPEDLILTENFEQLADNSSFYDDIALL